MAWRKLGRVFVADGQREWMQSHTAMPMALDMGGGRVRVYFGTRNRRNQPHVGFVDIHMAEPTRVVTVAESPVLAPGPLGYFDDNGLYPGALVRNGGDVRMYYMGRSNGEGGMYYMAIGLAISGDGGETFHRYSDAPVVARSSHDPWMVSTPWVLNEGGRWRMWYLSGLGWDPDLSKGISRYHIKYAESRDGIHWQREGVVAVDLGADETNVAAPTILRSESGYEMWYCCVRNGHGYRLGYADSEDGDRWTRKDTAVGIGLSPAGWDSECMAYPCVFIHEENKFLLYSGNGNGRDGIGIAIWE